MAWLAERSKTQVAHGHAGTCLNDPNPRTRTRRRPALRLLVGEARQSSQVTPFGAGRVAAVDVSELFTDPCGYGRFQRCGADGSPSVEMAEACLQQHAGFMAMGSHAGKNIGSGMIQVEEN